LTFIGFLLRKICYQPSVAISDHIKYSTVRDKNFTDSYYGHPV